MLSLNHGDIFCPTGVFAGSSVTLGDSGGADVELCSCDAEFDLARCILPFPLLVRLFVSSRSLPAVFCFEPCSLSSARLCAPSAD